MTRGGAKPSITTIKEDYNQEDLRSLHCGNKTITNSPTHYYPVILPEHPSETKIFTNEDEILLEAYYIKQALVRFVPSCFAI
ncbi:hypothetical protein Tco_0580631 [Tanacetum coccineum]